MYHPQCRREGLNLVDDGITHVRGYDLAALQGAGQCRIGCREARLAHYCLADHGAQFGFRELAGGVCLEPLPDLGGIHRA